jgi:hypothetical protein
VIAIAVVGLTALGCAARPFEDVGDEFGEATDDEADSSESSTGSTGSSTTNDTFETTDDAWDDPSTDDPNPTDWDESTDDFTTETTSEESTDESTTDGGELPNGSTCTIDWECSSNNCYVVPFLGGQCGECNEDADCADSTGGGCTPPNPFEANGSTCNMGEMGGGCETSDVCAEGLSCGNVLDLLGLIQINTCGECMDDTECADGTICAPVVSVMDFSGVNTCIEPNSLAQDSFCKLDGNGNEACASMICSTIDIMGLAMIGACGECNTDADCMGMGGGTCVPGEFNLDTAALSGSTCQ